MSTANEFEDVMPHVVKVTSKSTKDDFGYEGWDTATARSYRCLIDENQSVQRNSEGVNLSMGLVAYVLAIPIDKTEPQDILMTDKVEIVLPKEYSRIRPLTSIARHWWTDGKLDNLELKFS